VDVSSGLIESVYRMASAIASLVEPESRRERAEEAASIAFLEAGSRCRTGIESPSLSWCVHPFILAASTTEGSKSIPRTRGQGSIVPSFERVDVVSEGAIFARMNGWTLARSGAGLSWV